MSFADLAMTYGIEVAVIAVVSIFIVGIIKVSFKKGFAKIDKSNCKPIYETLSIVLAYGLVAAWIGIKLATGRVESFDWKVFLAEASTTYAAVKVAYPLYENYKLRDLLQLIGKAIVNLFKKKEPYKTPVIEDTIEEPIEVEEEPKKEPLVI